MFEWSNSLLLIAIIAGVVGYGGFAVPYPAAWRVAFVVLATASFMCRFHEYRERLMR
jgi:uncharacterized membrane protein YtjA (UPF0391 family)